MLFHEQEVNMNKKYIIIVAILVMAIFAFPYMVQAVQYDSVNCKYYGMPIYRYLCTDGQRFLTYQAMESYYVPPLVETDPDYTFITGGQTEGLTAK